jgi:glycosyl transferase, family 25
LPLRAGIERTRQRELQNVSLQPPISYNLAAIGNHDGSDDVVTHMPVLLLNLCSAAHRLAAMQNQLDKLGIQFERFPAVVGNELTVEELARTVPLHLWEGKRAPSSGEVGCFLNHRSLLQRIANGNSPFACILEDDIKLSSDFRDILLAAEELPPGTDVIKLEIAKPLPAIPYILIGKLAGRELVFVSECGWPGSAAYIVTASGARRILAALQTMREMYDYQAFDYARYNLLIYHLFPLPAVQMQESEIARPGKLPKVRPPFFKRLHRKWTKNRNAWQIRAGRIQFQLARFGLRKALTDKRRCKRENLVRL